MRLKTPVFSLFSFFLFRKCDGGEYAAIHTATLSALHFSDINACKCIYYMCIVTLCSCTQKSARFAWSVALVYVFQKIIFPSWTSSFPSLRQRRRERALSSFSTFYPLSFHYRRALCFVFVSHIYTFFGGNCAPCMLTVWPNNKCFFFHKWNNANNIVYINFKREATASVCSKCSSSWRHQFDAQKKRAKVHANGRAEHLWLR